MKRTTRTQSRRNIYTKRPFPNAATTAYRINKLIDYLLTGATAFGIVAAILFLVTL